MAISPALPGVPFRRQDALELGWTRRTLQAAVDDGRLRHVLHDVYVESSADDCQELRLDCLRLVMAPHAVVVDRTAAWLWEVELVKPVSEVVQPLEVFVLRGRNRIERPQVASGERDLLDEDLTTIDGVTVTVPARTALELASRCGRYDARAA